MKRIVVTLCAVLGLAVSNGTCQASWGHLFYSGYQPWWNVFAKRYKCLTPEEERLQKFWHDYYDAMKCFYKSMDAIDWVAYYKNHGYAINCGGGPGCPPGCMPGCGRINYAPVFVTPSLQWAVPAGMCGGPPVGPPPGMMGGGGGAPYPMTMGGPGMFPTPYPMAAMGPGGHGAAIPAPGGTAPGGGSPGGAPPQSQTAPSSAPPAGGAGPAAAPVSMLHLPGMMP